MESRVLYGFSVFLVFHDVVFISLFILLIKLRDFSLFIDGFQIVDEFRPYYFRIIVRFPFTCASVMRHACYFYYLQ